MNDLRFAIRLLLKRPGFAAVAILSLALGIGANTAVFSVIHALLLAPLPYPNPDRLVTLWERSQDRGVEQERVSGPNYLDWRQQNSVLADLAVCPGWDGAETFNLVLRDGTTRVRATYASASFFTVLGATPVLGRPLLPGEDAKEASRSVVLSHGLWQRHFGGDTNILGRTLTVDSYGRRDYTVVGVMPRGFGLPSGNEMWLALGWMGVSLDERRGAHWHNVIARLKPGVTIAQARAELSTIQARLKQAHPEATIGSEVAVVPLVEQALGRNLRTGLWILWGVVAGVLLIACANLANLLMARAISRQKEMGVRLALGAGRWRVVRQLLVESLLLSCLGGAAGSLLAWWGVQLFVAASPADVPRLSDVRLSGLVLGFTLVVSLLTGAVSGIVPAWLASRADPGDSLKDTARGVSASSGVGRARNLLVVVEVALSLVLLAGAGLMLQSLAHMLRVERGFTSAHLLTVELDFSVSGFSGWTRPTGTRPQVALAQLMERLRALAGVESVGAGSRLLRRENRPPDEPVAIFGRESPERENQPKAHFSGISPNWIRTLGLRVEQGRDFTEADTLLAPGAVIVNESFARKYSPGTSPIGQYVKMGRSQPALGATNVWGLPEWSQVVGIVSDAKTLHPQPIAFPEVYVSYWQWPMQSPTLLVRAIGDAAALATAIRREIRDTIPQLPAPRIQTMDALLADTVAQPRLQTGLLALFGAVALVLTAIGLYGVIALSVGQRTRELGVRFALGAQKRAVLALVLGQGMRLVLAGIAAGVLASIAVTRLMRNLLYEISPTDPPTLIAVAGVLAAVALVACWAPARRASRVDPMVALRTE